MAGVLFTYSLSLMLNWAQAWDRAKSVLCPSGRTAVVDLQPRERLKNSSDADRRLQVGIARVLEPLARLACWMGGSDISARPWTALERDCAEVSCQTLRGGHIQIRAGTLMGSPD